MRTERNCNEGEAVASVAHSERANIKDARKECRENLCGLSRRCSRSELLNTSTAVQSPEREKGAGAP